jgi:hypothetical protein
VPCHPGYQAAATLDPKLAPPCRPVEIFASGCAETRAKYDKAKRRDIYIVDVAAKVWTIFQGDKS